MSIIINSITKHINPDKSVYFEIQQTETIVSTKIVQAADYDSEITGLQNNITAVQAQKAALATPTSVIDLSK